MSAAHYIRSTISQMCYTLEKTIEQMDDDELMKTTLLASQDNEDDPSILFDITIKHTQFNNNGQAKHHVADNH